MTSYMAVTGLRDEGAGVILRTLVVPSDVDVRAEWADITCQAVAVHETLLHPGGPDPDPWVSEAHRIDQVLLELGWGATGGDRSDLRLFPVVRVGQWRAQLLVHLDGSRHAVVRNIPGDVIADYVLAEEDLEHALTAHGWNVHGQLPGWSEDVLAVSPANWMRLVQDSTEARKQSREAAADADTRWRELLREAVLAGEEVKVLASVCGVTPQRIYQIRDRRR